MALLRITAMALLVAGCVGEIPQTGGSTDPTVTPEQRIAMQKFETEAFPIFNSVCAACHAGSYPEVMFLKQNPGDTLTAALMRPAILAFRDPTSMVSVINFEDPSTSALLTRGAHESTPALSGPQHDAFYDWLNAEKDAQTAMTTTTTLETVKVDVLPCTGVAGDATCPVNRIQLDSLGFAGAEIDFLAQAVGGSLYVTDLYVKAGAVGLYLEHPLFASWPTTGDGIVDTVDRFGAVKLNLPASTTAAACPGPSCDHLGVGEALFVGFPSSNKISVSFRVIDKHRDDASTTTTVAGCGAAGLASFDTNVKPVLSPICASCHAGTANAGARNAMDLSKLATATDNTTCLQVYSHLSFTAGTTSGLLLAPTPGVDAGHPAQGKLSTTTNPTLVNFTNGVYAWIAVEKLALP